jgi:hypothetical protein
MHGLMNPAVFGFQSFSFSVVHFRLFSLSINSSRIEIFNATERPTHTHTHTPKHTLKLWLVVFESIKDSFECDLSLCDQAFHFLASISSV